MNRWIRRGVGVGVLTAGLVLAGAAGAQAATPHDWTITGGTGGNGGYYGGDGGTGVSLPSTFSGPGIPAPAFFGPNAHISGGNGGYGGWQGGDGGTGVYVR